MPLGTWVGGGRPPPGVQLAEPHSIPTVTREADVSHLGRGEHPVLAEQPADGTIPIGESAPRIEQPLLDIAMTQRPWRTPSRFPSDHPHSTTESGFSSEPSAAR
jgi:hypothetical protein